MRSVKRNWSVQRRQAGLCKQFIRMGDYSSAWLTGNTIPRQQWSHQHRRRRPLLGYCGAAVGSGAGELRRSTPPRRRLGTMTRRVGLRPAHARASVRPGLRHPSSTKALTLQARVPTLAALYPTTPTAPMDPTRQLGVRRRASSFGRHVSIGIAIGEPVQPVLALNRTVRPSSL